MPKPDSPEYIADGGIKAQKAILRGNKDNPKTDEQKLKEALAPRHVAISLTGEPTLYNDVDDLVRVFYQLGFTTFLISNGTRPRPLAKLSQEPTQPYILSAREKTYEQVCRPQIQRLGKK